MQAIWSFLLDNDFVHAYQHGFVVKFPDGIFRRIFPRIFTYAVDYPEKSAEYFYLFHCTYRYQGFTCLHEISWQVSLPTMSCQQRQDLQIRDNV